MNGPTESRPSSRKTGGSSIDLMNVILKSPAPESVPVRGTQSAPDPDLCRFLPRNATLKILLSFCIWSALVFRGAAEAEETLSQEAIVGVVLRENPAIKATRAKWEMIRARVPQASAWEDLRVSFDSVAGRFVSVPPNAFMDQTVMIEQELPLFGKESQPRPSGNCRGRGCIRGVPAR